MQLCLVLNLQTLQRGSADSAQMKALKQQLEAAQVARAAAEGRVDFLKGKVRLQSSICLDSTAQLVVHQLRLAQCTKWRSFSMCSSFIMSVSGGIVLTIRKKSLCDVQSRASACWVDTA